MFRTACWDVSQDPSYSDALKGYVDLVAQMVECGVGRDFACAWPGTFNDPGPCSECRVGCRMLLET
jgi:hypothetical protein